MPCMTYDDGPSPEEIRASQQAIAKRERDNAVAEASLCALIRAFGFEKVAVSIDQESGVDRKDLYSWWVDHQAKDAQRRSREQSARRQEDLRKAALSKLSPAEKKALGIE